MRGRQPLAVLCPLNYSMAIHFYQSRPFVDYVTGLVLLLLALYSLPPPDLSSDTYARIMSLTEAGPM